MRAGSTWTFDIYALKHIEWESQNLSPTTWIIDTRNIIYEVMLLKKVLYFSNINMVME